MMYVFVVLLAVLCAGVCEGATYGPIDINYFSLGKMVELSDLVVVGKVRSLDYVMRDDVLPDGRSGITTDVTVQVVTLIKGKPNHGKKHVRFMIEGGKWFSEKYDEYVTKEASIYPQFELDEIALFFLTNSDDNIYYENFPHNGYHLVLDKYGKRLLKDDALEFAYDGGIVKMSLNVTTELSKAIAADDYAGKLLENRIKTLVKQSDEREVFLPMNVSKKILKDAKKITEKGKKNAK